MEVGLVGSTVGRRSLLGLFCLFTLLLLLPWAESESVTQEETLIPEDNELRLIRHTTKNYEQVREVLPSKNHTEPISIIFDIAYSQLVELDSRNQIMTSYIWVRQFWDNYRLKWNPDDYGGIKSTHVSPTLVWVPDIVLYNNINANTIGEMFKFDTKIILHHDGKHTWFAPTLIKSMCKIDITFFPFDEQVCSLVFGSWTYTSEYLLLNIKGPDPDLSKYTPNGQWDLNKMTLKRNVVKYSCCVFPFMDVTYTVHLRRRPLFYILNMIIPCILLAALSIFSFALPPGSGERIALVITLLLGLTVYMLIFTENIPKTSEVTPLINRFFNVVLFEVAVCLVATSVTLQFYHYHDPDKDLPKWLNFLIFNCLGTLMRMKMKGMGKTDDNVSRHSSKTISLASSPILPRLHGKCKFCSISPIGSSYRLPIPKDAMEDKVDDIQSKLNDLHKTMIGKLTSARNRERWHFAALVLDRFFCYVTGSIFVFALLSFYLMIPAAGK